MMTPMRRTVARSPHWRSSITTRSGVARRRDERTRSSHAVTTRSPAARVAREIAALAAHAFEERTDESRGLVTSGLHGVAHRSAVSANDEPTLMLSPREPHVTRFEVLLARARSPARQPRFSSRPATPVTTRSAARTSAMHSSTSPTSAASSRSRPTCGVGLPRSVRGCAALLADEDRVVAVTDHVEACSSRRALIASTLGMPESLPGARSRICAARSMTSPM